MYLDSVQRLCDFTLLLLLFLWLVLLIQFKYLLRNFQLHFNLCIRKTSQYNQQDWWNKRHVLNAHKTVCIYLRVNRLHFHKWKHFCLRCLAPQFSQFQYVQQNYVIFLTQYIDVTEIADKYCTGSLLCVIQSLNTLTA